MEAQSSEPQPPPIDQVSRDRFALEIDRNFSVIAPAGTGKTRAIIDRIVHLAKSGFAGSGKTMPCLVVVTYTNKAADEMQVRARNELLKAGGGTEAVGRLRNAFFGTIHSFCGELLRQFGPEAGLPSNFDIVDDDQALWGEFFRKTDSFTSFLSEEIQKGLMRHVPLPKILELARNYRLPVGESDNCPARPYPRLRLEHLLNFEPTNKRALKGISEGKELVESWLSELETGAGTDYLPLPEFTKGGKDFQNRWKASFRPLRDWLEEATLDLVGEIARQYRWFRVSTGRLTYDDLIDLALELVREEAAGRRIRGFGYSILLDEAQDTDARQFEVLTEVARSPAAIGRWLESNEDPPEPGRFCMVGDPQQSIYGSRADLPTYRRIHRNLVENGTADALVFSVTFRCSEGIVGAVNEFFPNILINDQTGDYSEQADFVPLSAKIDAGAGQVARILFTPSAKLVSIKAEHARAREFAQTFAEWFQTQALDDFQAGDLSEVAILCPRNDWLRTLDRAFSERGITTQLHPGSGTQGENPAYLWLTALLTVISQPENSFEIVGTLREIYGISDHDLAEYRHRWQKDNTGKAFQILVPIGGAGVVAGTLNELARIRGEVAGKTLRDAVSHLVETICLQERLSVLPNFSEEEISGVFEELQVAAARAENDRLSLDEWALTLAGQFSKRTRAGPKKRGHLQLLSCHMAKGLEWDAVILPFLHRRVRYGKSNYPTLRQAGPTENPRLALDSQHKFGSLEAKVAEIQSFEMERLLYVATTRARHSLVLIDDGAFFPKSGHSFAEKLRILPDGANTEAWLKLPGNLRKKTTKVEVEESAGEVTVPMRETLDASCFADAQAKAGNFIQRILPSSLAHWEGASVSRDEPEPLLGHEFPEESLAKDGAAYGNWWHEMMEKTPWPGSADDWKNHFLDSLNHCPDKERGAGEIELFGNSELAKKLAEPGWVIHTEIPFLWQADNATAYEGIIDMAARDTNGGGSRWFLVDWKTDRMEEGKLAETLKTRYSKQVGVYAQAVQSIYAEPVESYLYTTVGGFSVPVDK